MLNQMYNKFVVLRMYYVLWLLILSVIETKENAEISSINAQRKVSLSIGSCSWLVEIIQKIISDT